MFKVQGPETLCFFSLPFHTAIWCQQKFAIPLDHMPVSVDNRKRSFHDRFPTLPFFYYQSVAPVNTSARNCNDEFSKLGVMNQTKRQDSGPLGLA